MEAIKLELQPRTPGVADIIDRCARKAIAFNQACVAIARLGFKTTSAYEMVRAREQEVA